MNYLVATTKPWNIEAFHKYTINLPGHWYLISDPKQLSVEKLKQLNPEFIFFPHWSWKVPEHITNFYPCICFHMTDLPFGRGGSPLQNLISRSFKTTKLSALLMTSELDAGPIYTKQELDLSGSAQQVFERAAQLVYTLIHRIIVEKLQPVEQTGEPELFQRRTPQQSLLPETTSAEQLYDFIRMLDAEGYPAAFIEYGRWRLEFNHAKHHANGEITATVHFSPKQGNKTWQ